MATIYYEQHGDIARLKGKQVAILGYGSQGHAHALNLKESGVSVVVGLYPGSPSGEKAKADGLKVVSVADAAAKSVADADLGGHAGRIAENIAGTVKDVADDVVKTAFNPSRNPNT